MCWFGWCYNSHVGAGVNVLCVTLNLFPFYYFESYLVDGFRILLDLYSQS